MSNVERARTCERFLKCISAKLRYGAKTQAPYRALATQCESPFFPKLRIKKTPQPSAQIYASPDSAPESNATAQSFELQVVEALPYKSLSGCCRRMISA
jgi:hypothetical protein